MEKKLNRSKSNERFYPNPILKNIPSNPPALNKTHSRSTENIPYLYPVNPFTVIKGATHSTATKLQDQYPKIIESPPKATSPISSSSYKSKNEVASTALPPYIPSRKTPSLRAGQAVL
jgi:hypothetical protein